MHILVPLITVPVSLPSAKSLPLNKLHKVNSMNLGWPQYTMYWQD